MTNSQKAFEEHCEKECITSLDYATDVIPHWEAGWLAAIEFAAKVCKEVSLENDSCLPDICAENIRKQGTE